MIPDICKTKPMIADRTQLVEECINCELAATCDYKKEKERQLWGKTPAEKIITMMLEDLPNRNMPFIFSKNGDSYKLSPGDFRDVEAKVSKIINEHVAIISNCTKNVSNRANNLSNDESDEETKRIIREKIEPKLGEIKEALKDACKDLDPEKTLRISRELGRLSIEDLFTPIN